jgi:hypothetical protein
MAERSNRDWILPAAIPFADLKARDLEECVYWLLDAMGAKGLEWRTGGSGGGAADGGRDLEAHFHVHSADGEIERQTWWIECKGRKDTVEPSEVKAAVNNSLAKSGLAYVVIATNTQFSNPTRDWLREWQKSHPQPKVKLWDQAQLERYLSRHPDVVLRLFSSALSIEGRFRAMQSRLWNKLEFVNVSTLADLWKVRHDMDLTPAGVFAAIVNEFAHGDVTCRPWGALLSEDQLEDVLECGLMNVVYLIHRSSMAGVDQKPLIRAFAYLILVAVTMLPAAKVAAQVVSGITRNGELELSDEALDLVVVPLADQLLSEMQDVCGSDCSRVTSLQRHTLSEDKDEVDTYWMRLEPEGRNEQTNDQHLRIESHAAPCVVGFPVGKDHGCPLFAFEATARNAEELFAIIKKVAAFRKAEAAVKRKGETTGSSDGGNTGCGSL